MSLLTLTFVLIDAHHDIEHIVERWNKPSVLKTKEREISRRSHDPRACL